MSSYRIHVLDMAGDRLARQRRKTHFRGRAGDDPGSLRLRHLAITQRLPVPVMVKATISGVIIEPSFSSSSVTTPEIGAKYGTRPTRDLPSRCGRRAGVEPERAEALPGGVDQVAIADLQRVQVFLLRAFEHRRVQREKTCPARTVSPMLRTFRPSTQPSARGLTCCTLRSSKLT